MAEERRARVACTDGDAREVGATREAVIFPGVGRHESLARGGQGGGDLRGQWEIGMAGTEGFIQV